jgi:hypothetical protein
MAEKPLDTAAYVDCMAEFLDLPIDPAFRPGVIDNLERIAAIAQSVLDFPLPDDLIAAPVFHPLPPPTELNHDH